MTGDHDPEIERIVKDALSDDFEDIKIVDICATSEVDSDGNEFLRIDVVFEGAEIDVNASKLSGAVRHVRPKLREMGRDAFPLFSFISNKDRDTRLGCA
ncbi:hypothetical protein [Methylocystis sp. S23]